MSSAFMQRILKAGDDGGSGDIIPASDHWKHALWDPADVASTITRVPILLVFFLFLWCIDLFVMDTIQLSYFQVLALRQSAGSPLSFNALTAIFYSILFGFHMTFVCQFMEVKLEYSVMAFYGLMLLSLTPFFPGHESRLYFYRTMKNIFFPGTKISFPEIMVADALCSLSKIFKDIGITIVVLYSGLYGSGSAVDYHNEAMILVAMLSSVPFALRIRQCNVQLSSAADFRAKLPISLNIVKYFTSFPPIWLAALGTVGYSHPLLGNLTLIMATINSTYSYLWDIIMDWGLLTFYSSPITVPSSQVPIFPPLSNFSFLVHVSISILNLLLRFSWAANRLPFFAHMSSAHLVFLLEAAEIFRRSVWFIFRIEWEMVNTELKKQHSGRSNVENDTKKLFSPEKK